MSQDHWTDSGKAYFNKFLAPARRMHRANAEFCKEYRHPSLQFKKLTERGGQELWSARVTLKYRALALKVDDDYLWFWIGEHDLYEGMI